MKKIIASLAAIATVLSMSVVAFAVDPGDSNAKAEDTQTVEADKETTFELDNGATVVAAAGAFDAGEVKIDMEATPVDNAAAGDASEAVSKAEGGEGVVFNTAISITAYSGDTKVDPKGNITITVVYDGASNAVAYVNDKKEVEAIELKVAEDKKTATFTVSHFSDFYMVTVKNVDAFLGKTTSKPGDENKPTGIAIAIVPAAIAAAAVVVSKKRK